MQKNWSATEDILILLASIVLILTYEGVNVGHSSFTFDIILPMAWGGMLLARTRCAILKNGSGDTQEKNSDVVRRLGMIGQLMLLIVDVYLIYDIICGYFAFNYLKGHYYGCIILFLAVAAFRIYLAFFWYQRDQ